jgi:hypothetical protein
MAYDQTLAARIREITGGIDGEVTGHPMNAMVFVEPAGLNGEALGE